MSPIPRSLLDRTPANFVYLGRCLAQLDDPRSAIAPAHLVPVRRFITAAIAGLMPPLAAATAITRAHEEAQIARLEADPGLVTCVTRLSMREARTRFGDPLGTIGRFVETHALDALEIIELELSASSHRTMIANGYLGGCASTRAFYEAYVHAEGTRIWRYLPLELLVFAALEAADGAFLDVELTADPLDLDQVRDHLARDRPARPLCVSCIPFDDGGFAVHGGMLDGYQMALHDLTHAVVLATRPRSRPREAVTLYDALASALRETAPSTAAKGQLAELLDHLISGYDSLSDGVEAVEARLEALSPVVGVEVIHRFRDRIVPVG